MSSLAEKILRRFVDREEYTNLMGNGVCIDGYVDLSPAEQEYLRSLGYTGDER